MPSLYTVNSVADAPSLTESFGIVDDRTDTTWIEVPPVVQRRIVVSRASEGRRIEDWEWRHRGSCEDSILDEDHLVYQYRVLREIEACLLQDRKEALAEGETPVSDESIESCKRIARPIMSWVLANPGLNWAAFGEENGAASLVLRSECTGRRVDFRISPDGQRLSVIRIDENYIATSIPLLLNDRHRIQESVAWVQSGS